MTDRSAADDTLPPSDLQFMQDYGSAAAEQAAEAIQRLGTVVGGHELTARGEVVALLQV